MTNRPALKPRHVASMVQIAFTLIMLAACLALVAVPFLVIIFRHSIAAGFVACLAVASLALAPLAKLAECLAGDPES